MAEDPSPPLADAQSYEPGAVLSGKYRIVCEIARGGMGTVFEALQLQPQRRVAIKVPHVLMHMQGSVTRFIREGRIAARIRNEHVAQVMDIGADADDTPYIVMEYVEGPTLEDWGKSRPSAPPEVAVSLMLQVLDGLAAAHAQGIVHRDMKPENVIVTRRSDGAPLVKIIDFGVSKIAKTEVDEASVTNVETMLGTPTYMSPEQFQNAKTVDARTDIWSCGVILYELLAGTPPFTGRTFIDILNNVQRGAAPLRSHAEALPEGLEAAVMRCLVRDPALRFQTVTELSEALAPFAAAAAPVREGTIRLTTAMLQEVSRHQLEKRAGAAERAGLGPPASGPRRGLPRRLAWNALVCLVIACIPLGTWALRSGRVDGLVIAVKRALPGGR